MCSMYIIKRHFVAKIEMICRFFPIAYYIYVFGQCLVSFGCIAVVRHFEILNNLASDTEL